MTEHDQIHDILSDNTVPLGRRLKLAVSLELDYWDSRRLQPNLGRHDFIRLVNFISDDQEGTWITRHSKAGSHGETGENKVFKFEFDTKILGVTNRYFVKGYFFDRHDLKGVTIQSFRMLPPKPPRLIRENHD